jgi:broad specificity phosphatase PhoE
VRLIFIRHGNTFEKGEVSRFVGARTDLPLTEFGKKQAENAADFVKKEGFSPTVVMHGSLKRQHETASIISKRLGLTNIKESQDLRELDYGKWENLSAEEIKFMWPEEFKKWEAEGTWPENIFPVKESEVRSELESWLVRTVRDYNGQDIAAVSSNGILRLFNKIFLGDKFNFSTSKVRTGAVCIVEVSSADNKNKAEIKKWDYLP